MMRKRHDVFGIVQALIIHVNRMVGMYDGTCRVPDLRAWPGSISYVHGCDRSVYRSSKRKRKTQLKKATWYYTISDVCTPATTIIRLRLPTH